MCDDDMTPPPLTAPLSVAVCALTTINTFDLRCGRTARCKN